MIENFETKQNNETIVKKRREISNLFMSESANVKNEKIETISANDLQLLFGLYDRIFFTNWFRESFKGDIRFSLSKRLTKSAGLTICPKNIDKIASEKLVIEIRIGVNFFYNYGLIRGQKTVCGIKTADSLEALQLVFEHELCHVIEFIHFKRSNCKAKRFKTLAFNVFGHTESCHRLPTQRQIVRQELGLSIGDTVSFTFEGRRLSGILYNIHKRATVMVRNNQGSLTDQKGNRYSKYYVPVTLLLKVGQL